MELKPAKKFGFGLMRLPVLEDKTIDFDQVCKMVDAFLEKGFTYFDTAYVYHGGDSERIVKDALVARHPRESFTLATKLPAWELKCEADVQRIFDEQLERTGAGYFDYYLLHSVEMAHVPTYDHYDCWNWILKMKEQGLVRHVGFSFHDSPELLDQLLTAHPEAEFVQLQLNYLDWDNNIIQSRGCYEVAVKHHVPVIVMEPVKGGTLASMPENAASIIKSANPDASLASWAIRFAASRENVMCVLSGMSNEEQMMDNLSTMNHFVPLTEEEEALVAKTAETLLSVPTVPCTGCRYCVDGCPQGILIPDLIRCLNNAKLYGMNNRASNFYQGYITEGSPAAQCIQCGQCEGVCPQHLPVIDVMKEAAETFE